MSASHNPTPTAAILVIGNEILSGRTQDTNVQFIAERLKKHGIRLKEVRVVLDCEDDIIAAVHVLRARYTFVFTTGGIGGTHDDITAATMAKAFNIAYVVNPEAHQRLLHHYKDQLNQNRFQMAYMPDDARLIDNPISGAPGFAVENVYCLAGMPSVMQGMFVTLLPTLKGGIPFISRSVTCDLREDDIAKALDENINTLLGRILSATI